jgi:hypothetical protein
VLGGDAGLGAEPAADGGRDHPDPLRIQLEQRRGEVSQQVRHLGGHVDGQLVLPIPGTGLHGDRVALQRYDGDALVLHPRPHHHLGPVQGVEPGDHTRRPARRGGVDTGQDAVRDRRAHEGEVQQTLDGEIVDVGAEPPHQFGVLDPADSGSDQ